MMEHPANSTRSKFSCAHLSFQVPGSTPRHGGDCDKLRGAFESFLCGVLENTSRALYRLSMCFTTELPL